MIRIAHMADLHACRERADEALQSLAVFTKTLSEKPVDLAIIAGDIWDSVVQNTTGSRFPEIVEAIRAIADHAPLVLLYGTPTHDIEGSLDVFRTLDSLFGITVIGPQEAAQKYFLSEDGNISSEKNKAKALIFGIPEPQKKWLMPSTESKTAAEAAVRDNLRNLFLGLGGLRKEHSELPCVLLYHGQVSGASLQNGDQIEGGSGISATIDDLLAVDADYIALGDLHQPQRVGESRGLQAYYPGSAYPINFGETHDAHFNVVTIDTSGSPGKQDDLFGAVTTSVLVEAVSFGHPQNRTLKLDAVPSLSGRGVDYLYQGKPITLDQLPLTSGYRYKVEVTAPKELATAVEADNLEQLILRGGVAGSIFKPNYLGTETVRAGEITAKRALRDKLAVWAENSGRTLPETVYLKADDLESRAKAGGVIGGGSRLRLRRLILRGAIGLWKKSRLEEIDWNFDDFDPGIIGLFSKNGAGKTTLIENMHPWPHLLTREGTLRSHFRGRDAFRDLYWIDEATGANYRAYITMDCGIASGATEYWLYRNTGNGWEPVPGITGRLEAYEQEINRLFGSIELYLRSVFVTQRQPKGLKSLEDSNATERKALFSALAGTEYLEAYKAIAHTEVDLKARWIEGETKVVESLKAQLLEKPVRQERENQILQSQPAQKKALEINDLDLEAAAKQAEEAGKRLDEYDRVASVVEGLHLTITKETAQKTTAETTIQALLRDVEAQAAAQGKIDEHTRLKAVEEAENAKYQQWLRAEREQDLKFQNSIQDHRTKGQGFETTLQKARDNHELAQRNLTSLETEIKLLESKIDNWPQAPEIQGAQRSVDKADMVFKAAHTELEEAIAAYNQPIDEQCKICGQKILGDALAHATAHKESQKARVTELRAEADRLIDAYRSECKNLENLVAADNARKTQAAEELGKKVSERGFLRQIEAEKKAELAKAATSLNEHNSKAPKRAESTPFDRTELEAAADALVWLNVDQARRIVESALTAQARIDELKPQIERHTKAISEAEEQIKKLSATTEDRESLVSKQEFFSKQLKFLTTEREELRERIIRTEAELIAVRADLSKMALIEQQIITKTQEVAREQTELSEWKILETACSNTGIQALELDAMAPSIMTIANGLLRDTFGSRYQVEVQTARLSGTGSRAKQVEDFLINVLDTETGDSQEISTLSGGERVWILRAIYDAFGIIRTQNTNLLFMTAFQDEADGQLDPEARVTYLRMLESAHRQSGRSHTVLITHSLELQALITNKVYVADLGRKVA